MKQNVPTVFYGWDARLLTKGTGREFWSLCLVYKKEQVWYNIGEKRVRGNANVYGKKRKAEQT